MNMEEIATKKRLRAWAELAPFYLDYAEAMQCNFSLNDLQWVKAPETSNADGYFELELLVSGQMEQNSFLAPMTVLYPAEETEISPEELVRANGTVISLESD